MVDMDGEKKKEVLKLLQQKIWKKRGKQIQIEMRAYHFVNFIFESSVILFSSI